MKAKSGEDGSAHTGQIINNGPFRDEISPTLGNRVRPGYGTRISRLILLSNDGPERFYRHVELHAPRVLACLLDLNSGTLGKAITTRDKEIKLVMAEHKDVVSGILKAVLRRENASQRERSGLEWRKRCGSRKVRRIKVRLETGEAGRDQNNWRMKTGHSPSFRAAVISTFPHVWVVTDGRFPAISHYRCFYQTFRTKVDCEVDVGRGTLCAWGLIFDRLPMDSGEVNFLQWCIGSWQQELRIRRGISCTRYEAGSHRQRTACALSRMICV